MSFSADVKAELARIKVEKKCDMLAEISGFFRVSGSLRLAGGGRFIIVASTENPAIARHYKTLIKEYFGSNARLEMEESQMPGRNGYRYSLTISPDEKSSQILRETGMMLIREGNDYLSDGIYQPIVSKKCCKKAYLRGLFLGCGTISNPNRSYHLEFVLTSEQVANDLKKLIGSFVDLSANVTRRKEDYIVYIKKADYISDILGIIGASQALGFRRNQGEPKHPGRSSADFQLRQCQRGPKPERLGGTGSEHSAHRRAGGTGLPVPGTSGRGENSPGTSGCQSG